MRMLPVLGLVAALALVAAAPLAEAGMRVGAQVCFEAIPISCIDACVDTPLSPPDFCPRISVPV